MLFALFAALDLKHRLGVVDLTALPGEFGDRLVGPLAEVGGVDQEALSAVQRAAA
jgi:hypothetical protein